MTSPPGREWMLRLADALGMLLDGLDAEDPASGEGAHAHGLSCGCPGCENDEPDAYCRTCGADVGIFMGRGEARLH